MMIEAYLSVVFAIGLFVSIQDTRKGLIRNSSLTLLMAVFACFFFANFSGFSSNAWAFLSNVALSVCLSVAVWAFGLWPSGDAKLFIVLSTMLPQELLASSLSPLSDLMINAFVPLFFFYFFAVTFRSGHELVKASLKKAFEPYRLVMVGISYLGMAWLISLPLALLGTNSIVVFMAIFFLTVELFYRIRKVNLEYLFIGAAVLRLIFDYRTVYDAGFIIPLVITVLVFTVFRFFFLDLAFTGNTQPVRLAELRPGMKLAEEITKKKDGSYEKKRALQFTIYDIIRGGAQEKCIHSISDEGLTADEVKKIQELSKSKKLGFDEILVHVSVPFALFLFAGFFLTVFFHGSFVPAIKAALFG